jgi:hypothetical protein
MSVTAKEQAELERAVRQQRHQPLGSTPRPPAKPARKPTRIKLTPR